MTTAVILLQPAPVLNPVPFGPPTRLDGRSRLLQPQTHRGREREQHMLPVDAHVTA